MRDPWREEKRPRMPKIMAEVLEEKKEDKNEGLWKALLREDEDLQDEIREKEEELRDPFSSNKRNELTLDDII